MDPNAGFGMSTGGVGVGCVPDHLSRLFFEPLFGLADIVEGLSELFEFSRPNFDAFPHEQGGGL